MVLGDVRQGSHQGEQKAVKMLQLVNGGESSLRKAPQASQSRSHGPGGGGGHTLQDRSTSWDTKLQAEGTAEAKAGGRMSRWEPRPWPCRPGGAGL